VWDSGPHFEILEDFAFIPDVVAGGDDVNAHVKELFGEGHVMPKPAAEFSRWRC